MIEKMVPLAVITDMADRGVIQVPEDVQLADVAEMAVRLTEPLELILAKLNEVIDAVNKLQETLPTSTGYKRYGYKSHDS